MRKATLFLTIVILLLSSSALPQSEKQASSEQDGHTRAPDHTRDRMGEFPSVAFWNWSQPSTDWFNLATGEALAEYNPSHGSRERSKGGSMLFIPMLSNSSSTKHNVYIVRPGANLDDEHLTGNEFSWDGLMPPRG